MEFYNDNGIKRKIGFCENRPNPNPFDRVKVESASNEFRGELWDEPKRLTFVYKIENGYSHNFTSEIYFKQ